MILCEYFVISSAFFTFLRWIFLIKEVNHSHISDSILVFDVYKSVKMKNKFFLVNNYFVYYFMSYDKMFLHRKVLYLANCLSE